MKGQARQRTTRGRVIKRWRLTLPSGRMVCTWAATKDGAISKCLVHRGVRPLRIEPAAPEINMLIRDAFQDDGES